MFSGKKHMNIHQQRHKLHFWITIENFSKTLILGLTHHNPIKLKRLILILVQQMNKKPSGGQEVAIFQEPLKPDELTLLNEVDLESPPTQEELSLLADGYEQRILDGVMARLHADSESQEKYLDKIEQ
jgi:hypothetical protein